MKTSIKAAKPLVAVDPIFQIVSVGTMKTFFSEPNSEADIRSTISNVFPSLMITPIATRNYPDKDILVHYCLC